MSRSLTRKMGGYRGKKFPYKQNSISKLSEDGEAGRCVILADHEPLQSFVYTSSATGTQ